MNPQLTCQLAYRLYKAAHPDIPDWHTLSETDFEPWFDAFWSTRHNGFDLRGPMIGPTNVDEDKVKYIQEAFSFIERIKEDTIMEMANAPSKEFKVLEDDLVLRIDANELFIKKNGTHRITFRDLDELLSIISTWQLACSVTTGIAQGVGAQGYLNLPLGSTYLEDPT